MITFVQGNLFDSPAQILTNTVNCVGVMGKGVALEFKARYPQMFEDYQKRCRAKALQPGGIYLWENDTTQILNFATKDHWRNNSQLQYITLGLQTLRTTYQDLGILSLAMPRIGCGNGGLNWDVVKQLMIDYLADLPDLEVYVYEHANTNAKKNKMDDREIATSSKIIEQPAAAPDLV